MHVCPPWLSFILYNPVRKALTNRGKILDESGIGPDSVVLEVGPGNGFLTEAIAERAKKVFSIELQEGMVKKLRARVGSFGEKVKIVLADIAVTGIPDDTFDSCLLYYSFHEIEEKQKAAGNIARAVKEGGILAIYEPSVEVGKSEMKKSIDIFIARGFEEERREDGWITRFARLRKTRPGEI